MSTINTDVWSLIFENTVQDDPSSLSTIRAVNRTWSETAENTPTLWTTLNLFQKRHFTDKEYVATHLKNSGVLALDLTIDLPDDVQYTSHIPIIDDIRGAVQRIRSLTLDMPYREAWQHFVIGIGKGKAAPLLESLIIKVKNDGQIITNRRKPITTFAECLTPSPKLKHFQFPAWPFAAAPPPQLATITSLAFDTPFSGIFITNLFSLVLATPNLEHFAYKSPDVGHESDPAFSNLIPVPTLLTANVTIPGFGLDLLRNFMAPLLKDVWLDGFRDGVPDHVWEEEWGSFITEPCSNLIRHLTTYSPKVRRLELNYVHFADPINDFQRIFTGQDLPELEELTLIKSNVPDEALVGGSPRIKKLVLRDCRYISKAGLLGFVQGRTKGDLELIVDSCPVSSREEVETLTLYK